MIYFDNSSTTRVSDVVLGKMYEFMKTENFANASSFHKLGYDVEKEVTKALEK